jgi:hypothetical protein
MFSLSNDVIAGDIANVKFSFHHQSVRRQSYPVGIINGMRPRSPNIVHSSRLYIYEDHPWDVPTSGGLIKVDIDLFELQVGISMVSSCVMWEVGVRKVFF